MWGSFKTIVSLYYNYNQEETEQKTAADIDDWVFIDKSGILSYFYFLYYFIL